MLEPWKSYRRISVILNTAVWPLWQNYTLFFSVKRECTAVCSPCSQEKGEGEARGFPNDYICDLTHMSPAVSRHTDLISLKKRSSFQLRTFTERSMFQRVWIEFWGQSLDKNYSGLCDKTSDFWFCECKKIYESLNEAPTLTPTPVLVLCELGRNL